ncbi:cyclin N-terminal domain-containing protein 1 [Leuresthes tenuis]|uniref:cyclin N-terminal domain-containing protein 1 n=1 Tax=Leuresthes tenuis TaxID=355514 RepID=UPI003B500B90
MAKRLLCSPRQPNVVNIKFRQASFDLLSDLLINSNKRNKDNLNSLPICSGSFKEKRLVEYIFLITQELGLDPLVGYHAVELLQRFMVKHLWDLLTAPTPQGAAAAEPRSYEDVIFDKLKDKLPLILFSCVQLANKLSLHCHMINSSTAVRFLHSVGLSVSKQTVLESELMVFKTLEFNLNVLNPLTYVEILLEVLGHNEPSIPVERIYNLCHPVLRFITLQRTAIYDALLRVTAQCVCPSREQREMFVSVTEDCMLLGVGVIAVATFIHYVRKWEQIVGELSNITGITRKSISDFAHVTLVHIVSSSSPVAQT